MKYLPRPRPARPALFAAACALLFAAVPGHRAAAQTYVDNGQTLNISSDTTYSSGLVVGNTGTGTVNQTGGTVTAPTTSSNNFTLGNQSGAVGYYNFSGGTINANTAGSQVNIGQSGQGVFVQTGNSTLNAYTFNLQTGTNSSYSMATGGTLNITSLFSVKVGNTYTQTGGTATVGGVFRVYGNSPMNLSGGSFTANSTSTAFTPGNLLGYYAAPNMTGTLNLSGTGAIAFTGSTLSVGLGGFGIINQSGTSTLTAAKGIVLGTQYTPFSGAAPYAGTGTVNLDGGTLSTTGITLGANATSGQSTYAPGTGTLNLNGGTLAALASTSSLFSVTAVNVRNGGAVIDTGANAVTIAQALTHSTISGDNANDGGLTKQGSGTLTLSAANTYTGQTAVNNGVLELNGGRIYNAGTTAGAVVINNGGTLRLDNNDSFGNASALTPVTFTVNAGGTLADNRSYNTLNAVTLNGGTLVASGPQSSTGGLGLAGTVTVTGTTPSTINESGQGDATDYVRLGVDTFNGQANAATVNVVSAGGRLNVNAPLTDNFDSAGALTKTGAGTLALNAANTYTGPTQVNAGTLLVNGSTAAASTITLATGTTLGGTGTINGTVSFGANTILAPGGVGATGIVTLAGGLTLANTSTFAAELNGTTAGSGYDRVAVLGAVTLNGATLQLTLGYTPTPGDRLIILDNQGTGAISGTFAGLANGAIINVNGATAQIYYTGDTATGTIGLGNDVELIFLTPGAVPEPSTWALLAAGAGLVGFVTLRRRRAA